MLRNKEVKTLSEQSLQTRELSHTLKSVLSPKIAQYCMLNSYRNGVLTLDTTTGSVATQLKFMQPQIMARMKHTREFQALQEIRIRNGAPPPKLDRQYTRPAPHVSEQNRSLIRQTADTIDDQPLAASLRKLADTLDDYGKK